MFSKINKEKNCDNDAKNTFRDNSFNFAGKIPHKQ